MKHLSLLFLLFFSNLVYSQQDEYLIINTSVNTEFAEFGVTYLKNNRVLFASSKKNDKDDRNKKNRRQNNRQLFLELYKGYCTKEGDIIQSEKFTNKSTNMFFESDISFTSDFKTVYFTWNNFYEPESKKDFEKLKPLYLFKASIDHKYLLSEITPLPFNNKNYSLRNPEVSHDDKKLYFVSDMPNGFGELDIYVVDIYPDGGFSLPRNLGPNVNTKHSEMFPHSSQKDVLYFSSNGYKKKRDFEILKSKYLNGHFQKSINLPSPFNGDYDDFSFVIDPTTNSGFFSSTRKESKGDSDIFSFIPKINQ